MSTIVVVKKGGAVAVGADTMTKLGRVRESADYIASKSKIVKVGDSFIAHVGHASLGLVLNSYFLPIEPKPQLNSCESIFETLRHLHQELKENYYLNPVEDTDDPFESTHMQCLIGNSSGIFGCYSLRSVQEYSKFYAFGSGSEFALGAMRALYNLDFSAEDIARAGLEAGADFDDSTGLPLEIYSVPLRDTP